MKRSSSIYVNRRCLGKSVLGALLALGFAGASALAQDNRPVAGMDRLMLEGGNGREAALSALLPEGKPVILHFWATWCGPCREELPELAEYARSLSANDQADQLIVIATERTDRSDIEQFLADDLGLSGFMTFQDKASDSRGVFGLFGIPETILMNADGTIAAKKTGAMPWGSARFRGGLQAFLAGN